VYWPKFNVIKPRRTRLVERLALSGNKRQMNTKFLLENLIGRENLGDLNVEGMVTLQWISKKLTLVK